MEEIAGLSVHRLTTVDHIICSVYGNHHHRNDSAHLDVDVTNDVVCQHHWKCILKLAMRWYDVLQWCIGCRFVQRLMAELKGAQTRGYKYEITLAFAAIIFPMAETFGPQSTSTRAYSSRCKFGTRYTLWHW